MKNRNFVNLNINPCKMCMPMGAVMALKGIENSMIMLHGSQGCSTYIRRHMAGHFNEPIDIASSSLSEQGTVYGGEENLKKGLLNLIKQYSPEIIGVATTCLAETIGEDIKRIISEFVIQEDLKGLKVIPISTPGYGGTQFEGYFAALLSMVKEIVKPSEPNKKLNIITGYMNPGDVRNLKRIIEAFEIEFTLLPDVSNTLDAPYQKEFKKIPEGGTKIQDMEKMSGALATIEICRTVPEKLSPGKFLLEQFEVPLFRCPMPIGIENTDLLINILSEVTGKEIPSVLKEDRGCLIDGMIDSHKYNAEGRAVLYGEPELVYSLTKLCLENGIKPVLISTGSQNEEFKKVLEEASGFMEEKPVIIDDTDFETIQKYSVDLKANILIGNSDGKFITEKEGIPLVRIGFPIHDRVGGQRQVYTAYNGSLKLLDDITNILLEEKYEAYRGKMYNNYFTEKVGEIMQKEENILNINEEKTKTHPCFSSGACENARMHIPIAPACNITCNYCSRKYDCVNESRPGVTSEVLSPEQAVIKFMAVKEKLPNLKVIGIAGPGDALANFENVKKSIQLIKEIDPNITFCLSTNGLMLPVYAQEIADLGVSHVTVTINAIDPKIGAKIYKEINFKGKKYYGHEAAKILLFNQLTGLKDLSGNGVICKVNIVMIKGINEEHIPEVVKMVKECGAFMTNIMPLIPAPGSAFENMQLTSNKELNELRKKCEIDLKQMYHCKQCRADAIGMLSEDVSSEFRNKDCGGSCSSKSEKNTNPFKYTFAVATKSGIIVDEHFGHVQEFHIYKSNGTEIEFVEKRIVDKYCTGAEECDSEESKIDKIIKIIEDCSAILVLRIGYRPSKLLEEKGIMVVQTCEDIKAGIKRALEVMTKAS